LLEPKIVYKSIYNAFKAHANERKKQINEGHSIDPKTTIGAQASKTPFQMTLSYVEIGQVQGLKIYLDTVAQHLKSR
jgi:aldehyde dehydrogenase